MFNKMLMSEMKLMDKRYRYVVLVRLIHIIVQSHNQSVFGAETICVN